ncbi:hypothetical protein LUR56_06250 [Streptomyces sp. MT29]|nr:hypothetical protein [Streptomyces sp. MT29]
MMMDRPVGQWQANSRREDGPGQNPEQAQQRAARLVAIAPDRNPDWPVDWQRHHAALAGLVAPGAWSGTWSTGRR